MKELKPEDTSRAVGYSYFIDAPQPTVTLFKTMDITHLMRFARRGERLNAMLCYTAGRAALQVPEFRLRVERRRLYELEPPYAVSFVSPTRTGGVAICAVPVDGDYAAFRQQYTERGAAAYEDASALSYAEEVVLGTSAMVETVLDGIVNLYSEAFCNPFLCWGRYEKHLFRTVLKASFQFHHTQMDGAHACRFLEAWQKEISLFRP